MLRAKIDDIIEKITDKNPVFVCSLFYEKNKPNKLNFEGITDTIPAYFFISPASDDEANNYDFDQTDWNGCGGHEVTGRFKLIAKFPCVDREKAVHLLSLQLQGMRAKLTAASCDNEKIYFEETGDKLQVDCDLIRINFELSCPLVQDCELTSLCAEDCC